MMKALTLHQPWASLVAVGAMTVETKPWASPYRGPLAIHAAKKPVLVDDPYYLNVLASAGLNPDGLTLGAILATCRLMECEKITRANIPCYPAYAFGNFRPGWYAWKLANIQALKDPIPARGHRGLWNWPISKIQ